MIDTIVEIATEVIHDSVYLFPFLYLAYLLIEFIEHKASDKINHFLTKFQKVSVIFASLFGALPQCGFSVVGAKLFAKRAITLGTLFAVFIATSDEAIPILLMYPERRGDLILLIVLKVIFAIIIGYAVDLFVKSKVDVGAEIEHDHHCHNCEPSTNIWLEAFKHSAKVFLYILLVNAVLTTTIHFLGEDRLGSILLNNSMFQPILASLIGLIPNCAASVVLSELFVGGTLSFGSLFAGLASNAGMGYVLLLKENKNMKQNIGIIVSIYVISVVIGMLLQLFL